LALVDVHLTLFPPEACFRTVASEAVEMIDALSTVARISGTLVDLFVAQFARVARWADALEIKGTVHRYAGGAILARKEEFSAKVLLGFTVDTLVEGGTVAGVKLIVIGI
jgi:hypothetical protein